MFLTFTNKVTKCLYIWLDCMSIQQSVHAPTLVNILQTSLNWYMLLTSAITWIVMKMAYMGLRISLQRHTEVFRYIAAYGEKFLKLFLTYLSCMKYNEINMCHLDIQNNVSYKNNINSLNNLNTDSFKKMPIYRLFLIKLDICELSLAKTIQRNSMKIG